MGKVRVRFAPSPTGKLHIGTLRTALFNYLFAKKQNGKIVLRFEDTDKERSTRDSEKNILSALSWLGLSFDEGPYRQMERLSIYKEYVEKLLKSKKAYPCFCTKEEIDKERREAERKKIAYCYSGKCASLTQEQIEKYKTKGRKPVIRFKLPAEKIKFKDLIKGDVEFDTSLYGDPIIMRADGIPIFSLANTVDDNEMGITHVIRGEDLLSSTPIQILLGKALNFKPLSYAHMSLTLAKDKTKLSKRHGAVAVTDYRDIGYLPEALINFIVLLGWHPGEGDTREFFTLSELEKEFSLERMGKSAAIFDIEKLNWFQEHYMREIATKKSLKEIKKTLNTNIEEGLLKKILQVYVIDGRILFFNDIYENHKYLFEELKYNPELLIFRKSDKEKTTRGLNLALDNLENFKKWEKLEKIKKILHKIVDDNSDLNFGDIFWPVRVALSGREKSPSPEELLWILGKEKSIKRIKKAISNLI